MGWGAVLIQDDDNSRERVVMYEAGSFNAAEKNYTVTERECLAVVKACEKLKHFIGGSMSFTVYTNHKALKIILILENPSGRLTRWQITLERYNFNYEYRPDWKKMQNQK